MQVTSTLEPLRNTRVRVVLADESEIFGVLRGITDERLFVDEEPVTRADITEISAAPLYCSSCGDSVFRVFDGLCASCTREIAKRRPRPVEACEVCGETPAFRSPSAGGKKPFLCINHHAEAGTLKVHPSVPVMAECAYEDVKSEKHEWGQVRGARFRCIRCKRAEKWDPGLLAELMKDQF